MVKYGTPDNNADLHVAVSTPNPIFPDSGTALIKREPPTMFIPLDDTALDTQIFGALRGWQHLDPGRNMVQEQPVVIAADKPAKLIETNGIYDHHPMIPARLLDGFLKLDELYARYGVQLPSRNSEYLGQLLIKGLVFDRAIRSAVLGKIDDWNILYTKYPKSNRMPPNIAGNISRFRHNQAEI